MILACIFSLFLSDELPLMWVKFFHLMVLVSSTQQWINAILHFNLHFKLSSTTQKFIQIQNIISHLMDMKDKKNSLNFMKTKSGCNCYLSTVSELFFTSLLITAITTNAFFYFTNSVRKILSLSSGNESKE